jgi:nitrite reductase/ring-hydroxylating ferredoxin subunit
MANSTSANLKLTVQATGENSGTWGQITNTNLLILEQAIGGYSGLTVNNTLGNTLTFTNGALSNGKDQVIKLTGTLAANVNVVVPDSVEKTYIIHDGCDHAGFTLTFKTSSGSGVLLCEGHKYVLYSDGTNVEKASEERVWRAITSAETVQTGAQILANTNGGAFTITLPASPSAGDEVSFIDQGYDFNTNALTVGRNGSNIANSAADLVVNTQGAGFSLVYSGDATTGWTYREK